MIGVAFFYFQELVVIHEKFLVRLQNAKKSNFQELSTIFLDFQELFMIYGEYCVNFPKSTDALSKVHKQNQAVRNCMEQNQEALQHGMFELQDLLAIPFQRFLKYRLFVDRLIQNTTPVSMISRQYMFKFLFISETYFLWIKKYLLE